MSGTRRVARRVARPAVVALLVVTGVSGCAEEATTPSRPTPAPAQVSTALASAIADAKRMAPALEGALRNTAYPTTLDGALQALAAAKIAPSTGNEVAGYRYDADTVEFTLCIEAPNGAFASYDTRPMALLRTGESGGCPTG